MKENQGKQREITQEIKLLKIQSVSLQGFGKIKQESSLRKDKSKKQKQFLEIEMIATFKKLKVLYKRIDIGESQVEIWKIRKSPRT